MTKICFAASSGGHFEQLMMLKPLMEKYASKNSDIPIFFVPQVNRHEKTMVLNLMKNIFLSVKIFAKEKPDVVICTGVLATIPMCLIAKLCRKKLIYIESFAKINSPTLTGKLMYKFADKFYVQWESMLKCYPKAIYKGGIY